jgi:hypothetical protein
MLHTCNMMQLISVYGEQWVESLRDIFSLAFDRDNYIIIPDNHGEPAMFFKSLGVPTFETTSLARQLRRHSAVEFPWELPMLSMVKSC